MGGANNQSPTNEPATAQGTQGGANLTKEFKEVYRESSENLVAGTWFIIRSH